MKKSDVDIIKQWIEYTGSESAPEDFSKKVMSRVRLENAYSFTNPINKKFILVAILVFTVLIILALTLPSASEYSWIKSIIERISGFLPELSEAFSFPSILIVARYIFYFSGGVIVFVLIDRFFARFIVSGKEYNGSV